MMSSNTETLCVWGAAAKRSISADLNWKSLSVQPLTSELPLLSTLWGERDTVWWSLIWRAYCSYSHKSLILPETLSFKCIFHLALHENNCACCHKIKNTYGLQQKVCHSALPTKYQQLNVFSLSDMSCLENQLRQFASIFQSVWQQ